MARSNTRVWTPFSRHITTGAACFGPSPASVCLAFPAMDLGQGALHSGASCTGKRLTGGILVAQIEGKERGHDPGTYRESPGKPQ